MKIFTIGYSGYERDKFVQTLKEHGVRCVIDVRSVPASHYRSEYNAAPLGKFLRGQGILYGNMPSEFGAQQSGRQFYHADGHMDFEKFSQSEQFRSGVNRLSEAARMGIVCALMCAEKDAVNCHRAILVARRLHEQGWQVIHIMPDGDEEHAALERRLLDMHFPQRGQFSMLEEMRSDGELLCEAYRLQNRKIGFVIHQEE